MWIMRCYRFMMTVIEKEIIKFLILAFMNFREVPKIRQKKNSTNIFRTAKTRFIVHIILHRRYFVVNWSYGFMSERYFVVSYAFLTTKVSFS